MWENRLVTETNSHYRVAPASRGDCSFPNVSLPYLVECGSQAANCTKYHQCQILVILHAAGSKQMTVTTYNILVVLCLDFNSYTYCILHL